MLVTIGNEFRSDDGIASMVADCLPEYANHSLCRYNLGPYVGLLAKCLAGHEAAIIVDATQNGTPAGTVSIADLRTILDRPGPLKILTCHGLSLADELRLAKATDVPLPPLIVLFGIEIDSTDWAKGLSPALTEQLPRLANYLSVLIAKLNESLESNARSNHCPVNT